MHTDQEIEEAPAIAILKLSVLHCLGCQNLRPSTAWAELSVVCVPSR